MRGEIFSDGFPIVQFPIVQNVFQSKSQVYRAFPVYFGELEKLPFEVSVFR